jgi:hypothetical protein
VPKYDAFGREIGEDTLQGLGGSPTPPQESSWEERTGREEAAWQEAERVEVARQETAADAKDAAAERAEDARQAAAGDANWTAPAADDAKRRRLAAQLSGLLQKSAGAPSSGMPTTVTVRRSGSAKGCLIAIIVVLLIGGAAIAGVVSLVNSVDVSTSGGGSIITVPKLTEGPQPKGLGEGSLMRRADVAAALRRLSSDEGTKLTNLRLAPERIDATLLTSEGRLRHVQVKPGGKVERFGSDSGPGFDTVSTIPYARVNPGAPQRLARRGAEEIGVPLNELQYAVPTLSGDDLTWVVYFTRGRYVLGDARGRFDRKFP